MPVQIEPVGAGEWMRTFFYAYPVWGKTSLVGTSAEIGRTLIVRSSMDLMPSRVLKIPGLDQVTCDTHEAMLEIQDMARMSDDWPYLWVWWDCVSIAQDVLLDDVWEAAAANKPQRAWILDKDGRATRKPNISPTGGKDKPEYGTNADRIAQWVRHMIGANRFHFGMTAHPFEGPHPTNDEGGDLLKPWVQVKQMSEKLCGYSNMVGFLEVLEDEEDETKRTRRLHVRENERFYAKDQYDAFPDGYIDNPTMKQIMVAAEKARGKPLGRVGQRAQPRTSTNGRGRRGAAPATTTGRGRGRR